MIWDYRYLDVEHRYRVNLLIFVDILDTCFYCPSTIRDNASARLGNYYGCLLCFNLQCYLYSTTVHQFV